MAYVDVFGGGVAEPSDVSFAEYSISADLPLSWPLLSQESGDVFARIMHVTATVAGLTVVMPPADQVGNGMSALVFNPGAESFDIDSYSGANLATVSPGEFKYLYITDNSTEGGSWSISAFGVGASSPDASALSGQGLIANAGKLDVWFPTSFIGGDYTIQATDLAHPQNVVGNVTITLPSSAAMGNGFWFSVGNGGTGTVTLQPTGADTINGLPSLALNPGETIFVLSFGVPGWGTLGKQAPVTFAFTQLVKDVSGSSDVTLTPLEASNTVLKFVGVLTGAINVIVPNVTAVYYVNHAATGGFAITVKTLAGGGVTTPEGARVIVECDGTDVLDAQTTLPSTISFGPGTAATPSIAFSGDPDTGIYQPAANQVGFTTAGVSKMYIDDTGEVHVTNKIVNAVGAVGTPSYTFEGDENTGIYQPAANQIGLTTDGVSRVYIDDTGEVHITNKIVNAVGAVGTPSYTFEGDENTGMYSPGADILAWSTLGITRLRLADTGKVLIGGAAGGNVNDCIQVGDTDTVLPIGITATTHRGIGLRYDTPETATVTASGIYVNINGADGSSAYTTDFFTGIHISNYTPGTNQTLTTAYGLYMNAQVGGTTNWNIYSAGATPSFFGGGVALGSPSSDVLDVYEEGSWTPTILDSSFSTSEGQTYSVQTGSYVRIGRLVTVTARIVLTSLGTLTTSEQVRIGGLPYTCASANFGGTVSYAAGLAVTAGESIALQSLSGVARLEANLWDSTAGTTSLLLSELSADGELRFTFTYETTD